MADRKTTATGGSHAGDLTVAELRSATILRTALHSGSEKRCAFCRTAIGCLDPGFEVLAEWQASRRTIHFHARCHDHWQVMREDGAAKRP